MIPNPIHKVLSTLSTHEVQYLLMGGQACVLYGAAEFSRDCDVAIVCDDKNLDRLRAALTDLDAEQIALPPLSADYLRRGHAIHFRCRVAEAAGLRIDIMSKLRGLDSASELWTRRTTIEDDSGRVIELMSLPDLIAAKKTQRDKDWPMIRRLVEAHYAQHFGADDDTFIVFWLRESRTPDMLLEIATQHPDLMAAVATQRPLLRDITSASPVEIEQRLADEQKDERKLDREYWEPLRKELEQLRRSRPRN